MKSIGILAMTYSNSVTQFETRHRQVGAEIERERITAVSRPAARPRRARRLFRAVRGAAAA